MAAHDTLTVGVQVRALFRVIAVLSSCRTVNSVSLNVEVGDERFDSSATQLFAPKIRIRSKLFIFTIGNFAIKFCIRFLFRLLFILNTNHMIASLKKGGSKMKGNAHCFFRDSKQSGRMFQDFRLSIISESNQAFITDESKEEPEELLCIERATMDLLSEDSLEVHGFACVNLEDPMALYECSVFFYPVISQKEAA